MQLFPMFRRAVAWSMLGMYVLVASGLPLPIGQPAAGTAAAAKLAGKDRSQPYPCMDKPCGCDSAERCFTNCCCHTPAETLAWAKARGIEPAVIDALSRRVAASAVPAGPSGGCCSAKASEPEASCCSVAESDPDASICSDYQSLAADPKESCDSDATPGIPIDPRSDESPSPRVVTLRAMLACGGIVAQWAAIGVSLPPPAIVRCDMAWPQVGVIVLDDSPVFGTGRLPDLPPPRGC